MKSWVRFADMCGIVGILLSKDLADEQGLSAVVSRMAATLSSRGPDGSGIFFDPYFACGHRRLSILDLTHTGAQPMRLGSDGPVITYNGEIYNFRDLRKALYDIGHKQWYGHSDTEVILRAYAEWGFEGLKRLEGIFALSIWDPAHRRLVMMRDRFGVKPLFYGQSQYGLAFGSEIKAVLAAGGIDKDMDDQAFSEFLWYGNTYGERTFYKGVRALEPGHWLIIEDGRQVLEPWWRIEEWLEESAFQPTDICEAASFVRDALDEAVARQLVADVPVGLFLSGGVDSSAIAASAIQYCNTSLQSYSAGFDFDRGINELPKAACVATHLGLDHHEVKVRGGDLEPILLTLARAHDEPFADAANIPLFLLCHQLRGQIKVVLQGDGGDELFAGYRRYSMLSNAELWNLWPQMMTPMVRRLGSKGRRFARMAETVGHSDSALRMAYLQTIETRHQPPESLFHPERQHQLLETTDPFLAYRMAAFRFAEHEPVQQMLLTDLTVQLPSQFLTKVDRATMAAGIEARVPLLDEKIARLAVNLPSHWKVTGQQKKIILRKSQRGRLNNDILDGPKIGFGVPYQDWLRTSLFEFTRQRILDRRFLEKFALNEAEVDRLLFRHRNRQGDRGFMLWKLLQLAIWD